MIRLRDAAMLALTKLRTRKVRLTVTVVVSGLLFSLLAGASFVARGSMAGISSFSKEGLGERYIVQAYPQSSSGFYQDAEIMDRALAIYKETVARKKTEAKRLGITYSEEADESPVQEFDYPGGKQRNLNPNHPAAKQAIQEKLDKTPQPDAKLFAATTEPYDVKALYQSQFQAMAYDQSAGQIQVLKDGKETYGDAEKSNEQFGPPTGIESFVTSWTSMSSELLEPFILPEQNLKTGDDGSIPIIVPRSAAEQLLGMKTLPASTSSEDRLNRTREIREKAPDLRFSACHRNATSSTLLQQAIGTKQEMEKNKDKKDYQKPSLVYGLPTEPCGSVPITRDVRSKAEKALAAKQQQFDEIFGAQPSAQSTLKFRIVGIVPDYDMNTGAVSVGQIVRSLVTSSLGGGWYTPIDQAETNPLIKSVFTPSIYNSPTFYAEFNTADAARKFIDKENCAIDYSKLGANNDPLALCMEQGKAFTVNAYGSNSLALESAKKDFGKFFGFAALAVSAIACIIMMGTVGRMIADSRRETAVFRAIGAKKIDISQIYIIYVIFLSLLIAVFALAVGLAFAMYVDYRYSAEVTIEAITAYNSQNLDKAFPLYAFYLPDMLLLVGLALGAGLVSSVFPLFRNLRRNPIRDMRDDT